MTWLLLLAASLITGILTWQPGHPENVIVFAVLTFGLGAMLVGYGRLNRARVEQHKRSRRS